MTLRRIGRPGRTAAAVAFLVLMGCVTPPAPNNAMAGVAPQLSVERFLQAANARDFEAMERLFGTYDGPIRGDRLELEVRMSLIADILRHEDYRIQGQRREPGREFPTTRVIVTLTQDGRDVTDVPFLVVRTKDGGWLVEEVDLALVTRG